MIYYIISYYIELYHIILNYIKLYYINDIIILCYSIYYVILYLTNWRVEAAFRVIFVILGLIGKLLFFQSCIFSRENGRISTWGCIIAYMYICIVKYNKKVNCGFCICLRVWILTSLNEGKGKFSYAASI